MKIKSIFLSYKSTKILLLHSKFTKFLFLTRILLFAVLIYYYFIASLKTKKDFRDSISNLSKILLKISSSIFRQSNFTKKPFSLYQLKKNYFLEFLLKLLYSTAPKDITMELTIVLYPPTLLPE